MNRFATKMSMTGSRWHKRQGAVALAHAQSSALPGAVIWVHPAGVLIAPVSAL